jgi:hypothetical protein
MPNIAEKLMTLDEFLAWEREQPERTNEIIQVDGVLNLSSIDVEISLGVIYEDTELDITPQPAGEAQAQGL